jgi:hypothetical protein
MMFKPGWLIGCLLSLSIIAPATAQDNPILIAQAEQMPGAFSNSNPMSYRNPMGMMPKFTPDFWNATNSDRLKTGTVLTGILEDTLSSKSSKPGDLFSIRLQDGFVQNGKEMIPQQSKLLGTVISVQSSKHLRHGEPGTVTLSLQTLVLPDGRHMSFFGNIDHNPSQDPKNKPGKQPIDFAGTGRRTLNTLVTMTTGRMGMAVRMGTPGLEFKIEKGEVLPVKCSRTMDLTQMIAAPATVSSPQGGMIPNTVPGMVPGLAQGQPMSYSLPQQQGMAAPAALSLTDMPAATPTPGMPAEPSYGSPNAVLSPSDIPDPF